MVPSLWLLLVLLTAPAPTHAQSVVHNSVRTQRIVTASPLKTPPPSPSPTPPQPSTPLPTQGDEVSQIEALVAQYTNDARQQNGLASLTSDTKLASIARTHSADMLAYSYFAHNDLSGCSPACRLSNAAYSWQAWGENIHWMYGYTMSVSAYAHKIVSDWMNSPEHRANILNTSFTHEGIGIAINGTTIYSTTDYALPQ